MENISEKKHISVLISSLEKIYNRFKLKGKSNTKELYILDAIYKLIGGCETALTGDQQRMLTMLYHKIGSTSDTICYSTILKQKIYEFKSSFIEVKCDESCNNIPNTDWIYYWQEDEIGKDFQDIFNDTLSDTFTSDKSRDTRGAFNTGKNITLTTVGKLCFLIVNIEQSATFKIRDINNIDVSTGFSIMYNDDKRAILVMSNNEYTPSNLTLKIQIDG